MNNDGAGHGYIFYADYTSVDGVYTIGITFISQSSSFTASTDVTIQNSVPCFKEDSKILTFNETLEKEEYIPIQEIRVGMLVKTFQHHYVKVEIIGKAQIYNSGDKNRILHRLYQYSNPKFPEIFEPLILTGGHSILVDELTEEQREKRGKYSDQSLKPMEKYIY